MNDLIELLTEGLTKLREDFNSLPNYEEQLSSIALQLNQLQENQLTKDNLKSTIDLLMSGYLATTKDDYLVMINALIEDIKTNNQTFLTNEIDNISNKVDTLIANAISSMKDDLNQFKSTIKNGKDGLNGINGVDGLDGKNGRDGLNGKDGKDGRDGINALSNGIKDIQLVNNELIITLDDNTIKTITMPTIKQAIGKVGGISKHSVQVMIDEALNSAVGSDSYTKEESDNLLGLKADKLNTYTKTETDTNIANAIDSLVNGASNILDSFGEVESVLGTLQTSINANSQAIANLEATSSIFSKSISLDFGVTGTKYKIFTINDADLTAGKKIGSVIYTPKNQIFSNNVVESIDDDEFDSLEFSLREINLGNFKLLVKSNGIINNNKTIQYTII